MDNKIEPLPKGMDAFKLMVALSIPGGAKYAALFICAVCALASDEEVTTMKELRELVRLWQTADRAGLKAFIDRQVDRTKAHEKAAEKRVEN